MGMSAWIVVADFGHINGAVSTAKSAGFEVKAVVVGSRGLAEAVAAASPDSIFWYEPDAQTPPEAYAGIVSERIAADNPQAVISLEDAASRVLWASAAVRLDAAVAGTFFEIFRDGALIRAKRMVADDRSIETVETSKVFAGIYAGPEPDSCGVSTEIIAVNAGAAIDASSSPNPAIRISPGSSRKVSAGGIKDAKRVVSVGYGVGKDQLDDVRKLACALDAEVGCTLPISNQLGWFDADRVVGVTHNSIAPELYIALGISGQPQHMTGVRDAKVVVGINTDPDAPIFKKCDYGIVGDVKELIPALIKRAQAQ